MLIENPKGNYSFLKGIAPYSGGVVASRGFAIEHARLQPALALRAGFAAVAGHLECPGLAYVDPVSQGSAALQTLGLSSYLRSFT